MSQKTTWTKSPADKVGVLNEKPCKTIINDDNNSVVKSKTQFQENDLPPDEDPDYNINVFHKKIIKMNAKKNNFKHLFIMDDIHDYLLDPVETTDFYDYNNNNMTNDIQEGFASPICSSSTNSTDTNMRNHKNAIFNLINYPFFFADRSIQFCSDVTCNLFVSLPPSLVNLVEKSTSNVNGILSDLSNGKIFTDISNATVGSGSSMLPDPETINFLNNLSPTDIANLGEPEISAVKNAYISDVKEQSFTDDQGNFSYKQWQNYVNSKGPDNKLVKKYINLVLIVLMSWFITNNWFFIMFLNLDNGEPIETTKISQNIIQNIPFIGGFLSYFFGCLMIPVILLDTLLLEKIPLFMKIIPFLNTPICLWLFTFFFIIYFILHFGSGIQDLIDKCVFHDYTATYTPLYSEFFWFLYISVGFTFIIDLFNTNLLMLRSPLLLILTRLIQFIIIMLLTPLSGILPIFYLLIYSFLAIGIYNNYNVFSGIKLIKQFIYKTAYSNEKNDSCDNSDNCTITQQLILFFKNSIKALYNYCIEISLIVILIYGMMDYTLNINNSELKAGLMIISLLFIFTIIFSSVIKNALFTSTGIKMNPDT